MSGPPEVGQWRGLTTAEARARLADVGPNALPASSRRGVWAIVREVVREPMFLLLVACGALYLVLGDPQEALMLLGFVVAVVALTVVQERRTERALDALRDLSAPRALVVRDGERQRIPGADVVPDDLLVVTEGERVPADATLVWCRHLSVDESLVTGEAMPVPKRPAPDAARDPYAVPPPRPPAAGPPAAPDAEQAEHSLYSGTLVVAGQGLARVTATGPRTTIGRIGAALQSLEAGASRLQAETRSIVRVVAIGGLALCVVIAIVYGLTRGDWLGGLLTGLATAMALLPEEFPVVLTVFLALGAWRISRRHVLTRRMAAIETLGSTTVLCADKTGTLTENRMAVRALWTPELAHVLPVSSHAAGPDVAAPPSGPELHEDLHGLVEFAILASQVEPFDPMEQAFRALGLASLAGTEHLHPDWSLVREYPLSPELLAMTRTWETDAGEVRVVSAKGAPEAVFDLCHLSPEETTALSAEVRALAARGLRVLGVARGEARVGALPDAQHDYDFEFVGLIGLEDPLRAGVAEAVARCRSAGIRVVMITGDYPETALSIARQAGLDVDQPVLTGAELAAYPEAPPAGAAAGAAAGAQDPLAERLAGVTVCARVVPEQKLRLVQALAARGEVVAMTGDGVNDAPALKAAHIGIAMGGRGTDVAREAAALVLLDDDFSSIVEAVALGRRIFDNLRKAMAYIVAIHVPIAGLATIPVLAGWPVALLPVHIVFLELVIDPACSIVFEAERAEADVMARPPRSPTTRLLDRRALGLALVQGGVLLGAAVAVFAWALGHTGQDPAFARTAAFATLMVGNLGLILTNRSWKVGAFALLGQPNRAFAWVVLGALATLALVVYVPGLNGLLHFVPLAPDALAIAASAGLASLLVGELGKRLLVRRA